MNHRTLPAPLALSLALLAPLACDEDDGLLSDVDADVEDDVEFRTLENTGLIGGVYLNTGALTLNKVFTLTNPNYNTDVHGYRLRNITNLPGGKVWNTVVSLIDQTAGRLAIMNTEGATLTDGSLTGIILHFDTTGDTTADLEVQLGAQTYDAGANLYYYPVHSRPAGSGAPFQPMCKGSTSWAIFADGDWKTDAIDRNSARGDTLSGNDTITLSCMDGAIHKCIANGRRPTDTLGEQRHEACVRAFTAAYDELAHTVTGMMIDIHEKSGAGITTPFVMLPGDVPNNGDLVKEAEWGPEGIRCVNRNALRRPGRVPGCGAVPAGQRTPANCVIKYSATNQTDVPECTDIYPANPNVFERTGTVMATFTSRVASTTSYDNVKDVYYGVEKGYDGKTMLFKGVVKDGVEELLQSGYVRKRVANGDGTYSLVDIEVDGLAYSDTFGLLGFEIDNATSQSRLVRVFPNGITHPLGGWFAGRVRGADINREQTWVVALVRGYPGHPNGNMLLVDPRTGAPAAAYAMTLNGSPFVLSNGCDIARRAWGEGITREWFIVDRNKLYSVPLSGPNTGVLTLHGTYGSNTIGASNARWFVGLAFQHPTASNNFVLADDKMLTMNVHHGSTSVDELRYVKVDLSSDFAMDASPIESPLVAGREGADGDLAAWVPSDWNPRQSHYRSYSPTYGHRYPRTLTEANAGDMYPESTSPYFYTHLVSQSFTVPFYECLLYGTRYLYTAHANCENAPYTQKTLIGHVVPPNTPRDGTIRLYRMYHPSGSHFFTTSVGERDYLLTVGWQHHSGGDALVWPDPS